MTEGIIEAIKLEFFQIAEVPNAVVIKIKLVSGQQVTFAMTPKGAVELAKQLDNAAAVAAMDTTENSFRQ
ncbi:MULTISPECIES: hypothetical protein [Bosea]|uniref:hypothetical protein n=1 Tax=Bosea TaxID=85413 RepID=UPI00214F81DA|nr:MULTISPECIES: hypothetical protein [Bosea]MCR4524472.1 hypothetical protein [Bosea sp. 47.2.35]MDR6831438.1 hypothetical protein [Bosea robiniae]MDR6898177.1 hypothetical protein [Bosea sp. BE109]MDR7141600.1 hypothetical protein [Bosea sp. BE168]MDR7178223.1 hypothetical protein [Bosea sp. BE271]